MSGTMKYDPEGISNHAAQVGKIGGEIETKLGELLGLINALPDVWASGSGESAAQAATDIKKAGDLVRQALAGHALSVQKSNQLFQDGDNAVKNYFQTHV
jgi:WXG100 family type VII secretion target